MRQRHSSTSIFMRSETSPADGHTILNRARRAVGGAIVASLLATTALSVPSIASAQNQGKNFKVAADIGLVPFFMKDASGKLDGFSYELAGELAKRMGYDGLEVVDTPFSAIFAGLFASRYDMVAGPVNITAERASQMLFTEPYMAGGLSFLTKKGVAIASLEDLKGKLIAVNNGSFSDRWLQDNQAKYGYEIQRFNKNNDAVQAVAIEDPTGCGDAHRAGVLYGLSSGWSWEDSARLGNVMGSIKIASGGPQNHRPLLEEVQRIFIDNYGSNPWSHAS